MPQRDADTGLEVPTIAEAVEAVAQDHDSLIPGSGPRLRRRITRAVTVALGTAVGLLYSFILRIPRDVLPDLAGPIGVERWRGILQLPIVPETPAAGGVIFAGDVGAEVPQLLQLVSPDGAIYEVDAPGSTVGGGGTVTAPVTCTEAGSVGDAPAGTILALVTPSAGLQSTATVAAGGLAGADAEGTEAKRVRVLDRLGSPPKAVNDAQIVEWVKQYAGATVRRVWVTPNDPDVGYVAIRFILEPGDGDPANAIASSTHVANVQAAIGGSAGYADPETGAARPYGDGLLPPPIRGDRVNTRTLTAQAVIVEVDTLTPDTAATRASVAANVRALFLERGAPSGTLTRNQIIGAIDSAPGEDSHTLAQPAADVAIGVDSFPVPSFVWPS